MKCQDCKCELAPWEEGEFTRCYDCDWKRTKSKFNAHVDAEKVLKAPPDPTPMIDGRGSEVPLRGYGKDHCVMCHKPNDRVGDPKPGLCLSCDFKTTREPPPTVEYHKRGQVTYSAWLLAYTVLAMSAGFAMGLAFGGGV